MQDVQERCRRCGHDAFVVRAGSLLRIAMTGAVPDAVNAVTDPFEAGAARCAQCGAECGASGGPAVTARLSRPVPVGLVHHAPGTEDGRLPPDAPLCACGSTTASLVLHGEAWSLVRRGILVGCVYGTRANVGDGHRWECTARPFGGCPSPTPPVHRSRAAALGNAADAQLGTGALVRAGERLPEGFSDGWAARPTPVRLRAAGLPGAVDGLVHIDEAWLYRPRGAVRTAELAVAGFLPEHLTAVYPRHPVPFRSGTRRPKCGGPHYGTWLNYVVDPEQLALWFRAGVWPCCASRWSSAGFEPEAARAWIGARFHQPDEASGWIAEDFGTADAKDWADAGVGAPPSARACADAGLSAKETPGWAWLWGGRGKRSSSASHGPSPGPEHLADLLEWRSTGMDPRTARRWSAAGLKPAEVRRWPPGHPDHPSDADLAVMAAMFTLLQ